jgi:hypothetical protein
LIKVRYRLNEEGVLLREDITDENDVIALNLLGRVDKITFRLLNEKDRWLTTYDSVKNRESYIRALVLNIQHKDWGEFKQWVAVGG